MTAPATIRRYDDARSFLARCGAWLVEREAENNLILGIAGTLARGNPEEFEPPVYLATVESDDGLVGCAVRTPPFKLALTRIPEVALPVLVADVARFYGTLDMVLGPEPTVHRFGMVWVEDRGGVAVTGMRQGIYELRSVTPPPRAAAGILRRAAPDDVGLLSDWGAAFVDETGVTNPNPRRMVIDLIADGALWVWQDRSVVSMAAARGPTPNGIRVGYVYTPEEHRRRGYASILVAELSQRLLDGGRQACFLYTDLANPTSNAIYTRIGYCRVCSVADVELHSARAP